MNKPQIINIEGAEGIGKTAQVNLLRNYFKEMNAYLMVQKLGYTTQKAMELFNSATKFLEAVPTGLVINDGSIARMLVEELATGTSKELVMSNNKDIIHAHEVMNHKFNTVNILLLPENMEMCQARIDKRQKLLRLDQKVVDPIVERNIIRGLFDFDDNMMNLNIRFKVIVVGEKDTMLKVHKEIVEILEGR